MPALGSPFVRQLRMMASAYQEASGTPSIDSAEVIGDTRPSVPAERSPVVSCCGAGDWSRQGPSPRPRSGSRIHSGPPRRGATRRSSSSVQVSLASHASTDATATGSRPRSTMRKSGSEGGASRSAVSSTPVRPPSTAGSTSILAQFPFTLADGVPAPPATRS
jgi:hypothetical protein